MNNPSVCIYTCSLLDWIQETAFFENIWTEWDMNTLCNTYFFFYHLYRWNRNSVHPCVKPTPRDVLLSLWMLQRQNWGTSWLSFLLSKGRRENLTAWDCAVAEVLILFRNFQIYRKFQKFMCENGLLFVRGKLLYFNSFWNRKCFPHKNRIAPPVENFLACIRTHPSCADWNVILLCSL